jgi:alpha-2-macroglobulin
MSRLCCIFVLSLLIVACGKEVPVEEFNSDYSLYENYVTNFTSGLVSVKSDIRVVLAFDHDEWKADEELSSSILEISPKTKGKLVALSQNVVAFIPENELEQDTEYRVTLNLDKLTEVPKELSEFNFSFKTLKQDFIIYTQDLQSYSKDWQYLNARLTSNDEMDIETAKELVSVVQNGKELAVKFDLQMSTTRDFLFVIDSIRREVEDSEITLKWDGTSHGIDTKGEQQFEIPGKSNFKILQMEVEDSEEQTLVINFTDPIQTGQNLKGLVQVQGVNTLRFLTQGNVLKVFFNETLDGELEVSVFQGITSVDGYKMKTDFSEKVSFSQLKPGIRFTKNGSILPSSSNLKVNFQAVNLSHVDVTVYKIYTNTVFQFLQENELSGNRNLRKVASPVATKKITLEKTGQNSLKKWSNYAIDLTDIITPDPGAIYRLEIGFKRSYSLYRCENTLVSEEEDEEKRDDYDVRSVDDYDYYDYYWYDNYDYYDQRNPCESSFYRRSPIGMNILASDLGVIVKRGDNGSYLFAVSNLLTTEPVSDATVELFTYQQQLIKRQTTSADGFASLKVDKYAYFAKISKDKQTTYIKLDEGMSNSVSSFDVSGQQLKKGLKGYIYGERGVWRPGDTLFLGFILNDSENPLNAKQPIKLKLRDPNGQEVIQLVQKYTSTNHYTFKIPTNVDCLTGNWEAVISVGGAHFYKRIKIETIKPNRLKISNSFQKEVLVADGLNTGNLQVNWLHGAVAKNLKVEITAKFIQQKTAFKNYSGYVFDDPIRSYETEEVNVFSGRIDENGKASYQINPKVKNEASGMLRAVVMTKAYENGGDFSTDVMTTNLSPYKTYIGLKTPEPNKYGMLETGKVNRFDLVSVDENGKPKTVKNLQVKIYKVSWRWWWDASYDNLSQYTSSYSNALVKSYTLTTNATGKAQFDFSATDAEWGRYLVRVYDPSSGHATGTTVIIDWPYWSGKSKNSSADNATMLVFSTDKTHYNVGEKAQISFPSSSGGRALISIENGSEVVQSMWVETQKGETKVELPLTAKMAPNVFVHITLLQPHNSTKNDSPIRMYGIIPIEVVDKETQLEPLIQMPDVLKPEQRFSVKIQEKTGKPMTYTLAIVDDGLLDLTRFKTPNAWNEFYAREALGVRTWDIYNEVIGAYGGKINQIFTIGGDEDLSGAKAKKANRFKPVVIYLGPFTLEKGQSKSHEITLPNYIGSVRTMVVAGDLKSEAYGKAEKTTPVRKPLMVLASLPRKLSPTEKITLPVTVFAMEKHVKNVTVQVKTGKGLSIVGSTSQTLEFSSPDEQMLYFELEANAVEGIGTLEVIATSGNEKAKYELEIAIDNPNPVTFEVEDAILNPTSSVSMTFTPFGTQGSNEAWLEISSMPAIDLSRRMSYLIRYPHGCLEQTTSTIFPQLFLDELVDLDTKQRSETQRNITEGIKKLAQFQLPSGGFAYWSGQATENDWGTSYVGHCLLEAEKRGYVLPLSFKSKWINYQQRVSKSWRFDSKKNDDFSQAYRLYTLALAGHADLSSMNRMRSISTLSNLAKLRLAAAYALVGQKTAANELIQNCRIDDATFNNRSHFGSLDRNRAMYLETILLVGDKQKAFAIAGKVAKSLTKEDWMSTQTTAYCLYSMALFAQQNGAKGIFTSYTIGGKTFKMETNKSIAREKLTVKKGINTLDLKNTKDNTLFVRLVTSGILPVGEEKVLQRNLVTDVRYQNKNNNSISVEKLEQGTSFYALITVRNTSTELVENIALTHQIPSGYEIVNTRFTDYGESGNNKADYTDIRDDRVNFYFSLKPGEQQEFKVLLNASYLGTYYLPGTQVEAMYDNNYFARTAGRWITVVK